MTNNELIEYAINAKKNAISPTNFHCGAAVLSESGKVYTGCNLGSNDCLFNICAERVAICKMLSEGEKSFTKIAVVGGMNDDLTYTTPCGICRQLISSFGKDIDIVLGYKNENNELEIKVLKVNELLPSDFSL